MDTAERDLICAILHTYFEDLDELLQISQRLRKFRITKILYEALHPWTRYLCFLIDIDHGDFFKGLKRKAQEVWNA